MTGAEALLAWLVLCEGAAASRCGCGVDGESIGGGVGAVMPVAQCAVPCLCHRPCVLLMLASLSTQGVQGERCNGWVATGEGMGR